jgi:hypothetical protein
MSWLRADEGVFEFQKWLRREDRSRADLRYGEDSVSVAVASRPASSSHTDLTLEPRAGSHLTQITCRTGLALNTVSNPSLSSSSIFTLAVAKETLTEYC